MNITFRLTRLVSPMAMLIYVDRLGLLQINGDDDRMSVYCDPANSKRQILIPMDTGLDDYSQRTSEVVARMAEFEECPISKVYGALIDITEEIL